MRGARHSGLIGAVTSVALFAAMVAGVHLVAQSERTRLQQELRSHTERQAAALLARLESELNADVYLANGLLAHINAMRGRLDGSVNDALRALHQHGRHIRNIGVAPNNRVSHVYPLEGNQSVLGLYYPDLPQQWAGVRAAIETRQTTMAGPLPLKQGGIALVSRTPVFIDNDRYWGVLSLVIDAEGLYQGAGLAPEVEGTRFALRGRDGKGERGEVFFGDPALFRDDAVLLALAVPGGRWQMAAMPVHGWQVIRPALAVAETVGFFIAALLAVAAYGYHRGRMAIAAKEWRLRTLLETTRDGVIVIDARGVIRDFNPAAETLFGYAKAEILGCSVERLMPAAEVFHAEGLRAARQVQGRRRDGSEFPIEVSVGEAEDQDGRMQVGIVRDITERKAFERRLMDMATLDGLTGALNRRAFLEVAENAFRLAQRYERPLSLLMIDADHFKAINDTYGHHVGDMVLTRLSGLCREGLRATDSFGRMGGEEFMALLPETDLAHALEVAERLLVSIRQTRIEIGDGRSVAFSISIGAACSLWSSLDVDAVMQQADRQLYRAKSEGRDRVCG